jgi:hypothetical protein
MSDECFICCTKEGKTEIEKAQDIFTNRRTFGYPIIKIAYAYGCNCSNTFAHNKCLLGINKCPTCRKTVSKPNLYVETRYDLIFGPLFRKIKSNPQLINKIEVFSGILILFSFGLLFACEKEFIVIEKNTKYMVLLGLLLFVQIIAGTILLMKDYFVKYWLYDEKMCQIKSL